MPATHGLHRRYRCGQLPGRSQDGHDAGRSLRRHRALVRAPCGDGPGGPVVVADPASAWWVDDQVGSLEIASLRARFAAGTLTPERVIEAVYDRIDAYDDPATFISHSSRADALAQARRLGDFDLTLPLWGIPCAVKDNIDAEGFDTTLACFEAAFEPDADAPVVASLR